MKSNIVIFGGGSILAKNFIKKYHQNNLIIISREEQKYNNLKLNIGEFMSEEKLDQIYLDIQKKLKYEKTIFILFSWAGGPRTNKKDQKIFEVNMNILINFFNLSKRILPSKVIFLSSAGAIYKDEIIDKNSKESDYTFPKTLYGSQKLLAEKFITLFSKILKIQFIILRISSAYGFDERFSDQGVINKWLYCAIKNKPLNLYNNINSQINFISFDQISQAIFSSCNIKEDGIFNIGTTTSITLENLIKEIKLVTNKKIFMKELNNSYRYFNIDTEKFFSVTGLKFKLEFRKDIKLIYDSILSI